ncbi:GAF domain-containing protein [Paenibacillus xerothermodurans]|nr:GAF domain-containing protein [Paenibacillus xerothermodurans]
MSEHGKPAVSPNSEERSTQNELLIDAAQYFTSSLSLDEVITRILDRALGVIEAADAGVLFIFDKRQGCLKPMACAGFLWDKMRHLALLPGESMTGITFQNKSPKIFESSNTVLRNTSSMSPSNKILYDQSLEPFRTTIGKHFKIQSVMCAPLLIKGECIGVMTIDNFTRSSFNENDLNLLITLSSLAAIALENARLYADEKGKKEQLEKLNAVIQSQNQQLSRINQTHDRLMKLLLSGRSTHEFGQAVFQTLENPIVVYDNLLSVLTQHLSSELTFDMHSPPFIAGLQTVIKKRSSIRIKADGRPYTPNSVMLFPIVAANEIFGVLTVIEGNRKLSDQDVVLAEQCCLVLALDLLQREAVYETEQRVKGEFLDELMSEKNIRTFRQQAKALGLSADDSFVFMVSEIESDTNWDHAAASKAAHRRFQQTIETELLSLNPYSLVIRRLNAFVIILSVSKELSDAIALQRSRSIAHKINHVLKQRHPGINCYIGIGRVCRNLDGFVQSYWDAKQCVSLSKSKKEINTVKDYVEMGAVQFILDQPKDALLQFAYGLLQPLLDCPPHKRTELLKALDAFILSGKRYKEAAAALKIHPNTLAYRIKRVEKILGCSIDQYSVFFDLQYAWQVLETLDLKNNLLENRE